jgi:apolipoprotein N-acyltransferase
MTEPRSVFPLGPATAASAAVLSGLLYWLAFPGVDAWPLAFVAFVPLLLALRGQSPKRALVLGLTSGLVMNVAGFSWLFVMLRSFSGLPATLCLLLLLIICTYQGGRIALMGWLFARGTQRGWPHAVVALGAFAASELIFPLLFPWYFGATVYEVHALAQVAELGGPVLIGVMLLGVSLSVEELVHSRLVQRAVNRSIMLSGLGGLAVSALFGYARIPRVDARAQAAEPLHVGIVQGNMGLMAKREQAQEGLSRHRRMTGDLTRLGVNLVVWSESSVNLNVSEGIYTAFYKANVTQDLGVQTIFGGVIVRGDPDPKHRRYFNSALISDTAGNITGRYDKEYLLYFGETLPFEATFPILRAWSPNSGRFSSGTGLDPLPFETTTGRHSASVLICYEDILPGFTNRMVRHAHPDLLVNITNDAWFGNTSEAWEHLALATFRSIEHRRYLVRSTNSGISAFVDPVGRIMVRSHPFRTEDIDAVVHLMHGRTVYELVGDIPAWALAAMALVFAVRRRRKPEV